MPIKTFDRTDLTIFCEMSVFEMKEKISDVKKSASKNLKRMIGNTILIYSCMMVIYLIVWLMVYQLGFGIRKCRF